MPATLASGRVPAARHTLQGVGARLRDMYTKTVPFFLNYTLSMYDSSTTLLHNSI